MREPYTVADEAPAQRVRKATPRKQLNTKNIPFKDRPFIAWDGEGDTKRDKYILFGCSKGDEISSPSLTALECFRLLIDVTEKYPHHINVAFAFDYDVTMMIRSLPIERQMELAKEGLTFFHEWRIEYRPKKWFVVTDRLRKKSARVFDIFTFFACSALKAWNEYLPEESILKEVIDGKAGRVNFAYEDLDEIRVYMQLELELYRKLAEKLRRLLAEMGVYPSGWYGPGAVAGAVMRKFDIRKAMCRELPDEVIVASQHAYFGGRFEQFYTGLYHGRVYQYDIRSAYPAALRMVPTLADGEWVRRDYSSEEAPQSCIDFSLYRVRYIASDNDTSLFTPSPFPYRDELHRVHYPNSVTGWYWGVEVNAALSSPNGRVEFLEAYEFYPADDSKPFAFIEQLFTQRQKWKDEGNPVQLAAKLVLNSMYGKLAQRVGWRIKTNEPPTWHQLEWAGFATSYCRAMMYRAISQNPDAVIAVETDGLFMTAPIDTGEDRRRLGDWESAEYRGIVYVQSGMYWLKEHDTGVPSQDWTKAKSRGFSVGNITLDEMLGKVDTLEPLQATTHRFLSLKAYAGKENLATWRDNTAFAMWGGAGKRFHNWELCPKCNGADTGLHHLIITFPIGGESVKHVLPWRDVIDELKQLYWEAAKHGDSPPEMQTLSLMAQTHSSSKTRGESLVSLLSGSKTR